MDKRENNIPYERRINVVYMGMGEPLDNLANVSKAIKILALNEGLAISPRRQTVSTSGLGSQIKKLGENGPWGLAGHIATCCY